MQSIESAEKRYRAAFERLKAGKTLVLTPGSGVSQNNVAKEAGRDPSALRKGRHPALIREIQAFVELTAQEAVHARQTRQRQKRARESLKDQLRIARSQRDYAQSKLLSAQQVLLEVLELNAALRSQIDQLRRGGREP